MKKNIMMRALQMLMVTLTCWLLYGCFSVTGMEGTYTIGAPSGELVGVDQSGSSPAVFPGTGDVPQQRAWSLQASEDKSRYRIVSVLSGQAVTVAGDGNSLSLQTPGESDGQLFRVMRNSLSLVTDQYLLVNTVTETALTLDAASDSGLSLTALDASTDQHWVLTELDIDPDDPGTTGDTMVENYAVELGNLKYSTGTNKKLCGYSVRYPDGKGSIKKYRYQNYLDGFARDMDDWSRGKFGYASVRTASQAVMPDNTRRSKSVLIREAKRGRSLGACNLNVFKGAFSGSNAPSRNQANCGGSGLSRYCLRHEAGHTWGLAHDGIHNQDSCDKVDSGVSQMSGYKTGFNIPHLHWLGWVEENQVKQLQWDNPSQDNYVYGEHWVSVRPLKVSGPEEEGEHPYGLVVDLRRSGNRLWLAPNKETRLKSPGESGYHRYEDALLGIVSAPFESSNLNKGHRWKGTSVYRFMDENRPWDDKLMDDMEVHVVRRTDKAMLVRIQPSDTYGSCSQLPEAAYVITKNNSSINNIDRLGRDNLNIEFQFKTDYKDRDSKCSKGMCDLRNVDVNDLWETCYFENDPEKTNLLQQGKVTISSGGQCRSKQTLKTKFNRSDRDVYGEVFSSNILCKAAYQCFYQVNDTVRFPVNGDRLVDTEQPVAIETVYPNEWKTIISRKRQGEDWTGGAF